MFTSREGKHLPFSCSKVNWIDGLTEFKRDRCSTSFTDIAEMTLSTYPDEDTKQECWKVGS